MTAVKEEKLRGRLCIRYGLDPWNRPLAIDKKLKAVSKAAKIYMHCGERVPEERKLKLLKVITDHFGLKSNEDVDNGVLQKAIGLVPDKEEMNAMKQEQFMKHAEDMVAALNGDYMQMIKTWRVHFVEEMEPQYLPKHWSVDSEPWPDWKKFVQDPDPTTRIIRSQCRFYG